MLKCASTGINVKDKQDYCARFRILKTVDFKTWKVCDVNMRTLSLRNTHTLVYK